MTLSACNLCKYHTNNTYCGHYFALCLKIVCIKEVNIYRQYKLFYGTLFYQIDL